MHYRHVDALELSDFEMKSKTQSPSVATKPPKMAWICMKKLVRKNYLLPAEIIVKLRSMVKSGRY